MDPNGPPGAGRTPSDILARRHAAGGRGSRALAIGSAGTLGVPVRLPGQEYGVDLTIRPPEEIQYPQSSDLYLQGESAAVATGTTVQVATFTLPAGTVGVLRSIMLYARSFTPAAQCDWTVRVNGGAVEGWTRRIPPQNSVYAAVAYGPDEVLIRLPASAVVELLVGVVAGGPLALGMQAAGWYYPATLGERYAAAWGIGV